jgi:hypothetical protein
LLTIDLADNLEGYHLFASDARLLAGVPLLDKPGTRRKPGKLVLALWRIAGGITVQLAKSLLNYCTDVLSLPVVFLRQTRKPLWMPF